MTAKSEKATLAQFLNQSNAATKLGNRAPELFIEWLAGSLLEYLPSAVTEIRDQTLSFAWALSVMRSPIQLRQLAEILGTISSTTDIGIHTVVMNLLHAKADMLELKIASCNSRWYVGGVINLDSMPEFHDKGYEICMRRLHCILNSVRQGVGN